MQRRGGPASRAPRLHLRLFECNDRECPEFNYKELLAQEESRRRAEKERKNADAPNGVRHPQSDDDEDVERIAKRFEQKYGGSSTYGKSKGRSKRDDYADIGAGYDENDSFIDNTDGYDEIIPPECDTAFGGFYINSGSLEFKNVGGTPSNAGDANAGDSSPPVHKKSHKRAPSSSDSEEESSSSEEESDASPSEKPRTDQNDRRKLNSVTDSDRSGEDAKKIEFDKPPKERPPRKKRKSSRDESGGSGQDVEALKKSAETFAPSASERGENNNNNNEASSDSRSSDSSKPRIVPSSDNHASSDSSRDAVLPAPIPVPVVAPPSVLPANMSPELSQLVQRLKTLSEAHFSSRTGKLSGTEVNDIILGLEIQSKKIKMSSRDRHAVFGYAAQLLRRGKAGLLQRARRLAEDHQRTNATLSPIDKLKAIIERMKPSLLEQYGVESQKIQELNKKIALQNATLDEDKKVPERRLPKRRFPWNDNVRAVLQEILKNRGMDANNGEEGVVNFLQTKILPLFPSGFVRMPTLLQQVRNPKLQKTPTDGKKILSKSFETKPYTIDISTTKCMKITNDSKSTENIHRSLSDNENVNISKNRGSTNFISTGVEVEEKQNTPKAADKNEKVLSVSIEKINMSTDESEKVENFKVQPDSVIALPTPSNNVSISITSVLTKKSESESLYSNLSKIDKVGHLIDSVIVKKVCDASKDSEKNFQHMPKGSSNICSVLNNTNTVIKSLESVCNNEEKLSPNMGSIKVKSPTALFDKPKIILPKTNPDFLNKQSGDNALLHMYSESKPIDKVFNKPNIQDLIKRKVPLPSSPSSVTVTPVKPEPKMNEATLSDNFVKPIYKSDYTVLNKSTNSSLKIVPNTQTKYSDSIINGNIQKETSHLIGIHPNDRNHSYSKPVSKNSDNVVTHTSVVMSGDFSSQKHHRFPKKSDMFGSSVHSTNDNKLSKNIYSVDQKATLKKTNVLNVDDNSSSDDCVEILDEMVTTKLSSKPNNSVPQREVPMFHSQQFNAKDEHLNPKEKYERTESVENSREKWIQSIAKSNLHNTYISSDVKSSMKKIGSYSNIKEMELIKAKETLPAVEVREANIHRHGINEKNENVTFSGSARTDTHSVIKDTGKADRFNNLVPEDNSGLVQIEKDSVREMMIDQDAFNTVMQNLKELQDFQMQGAHQRLYDDPSNS